MSRPDRVGPRTRWTRWTRVTQSLVALACAGLASCGWHAGLGLPEGHRTVGVEIFELERDILERNLEPIVADALSRAVTDYVRAPIVAPRDADVVVRGRILDYRFRAGIRDTQNQLQETGLYVRVAAELVDGRSGEVLVPLRESSVWSGYHLGPDAAAHEASARVRALEYVAETLVLDLFRPDARSEPPVTGGSGAPSPTNISSGAVPAPRAALGPLPAPIHENRASGVSESQPTARVAETRRL